MNIIYLYAVYWLADDHLHSETMSHPHYHPQFQTQGAV